MRWTKWWRANAGGEKILSLSIHNHKTFHVGIGSGCIRLRILLNLR